MSPNKSFNWKDIKWKDILWALGAGAQGGFILVLPVLGGLALGYWLGLHFGFRFPWLALLLALIGAIVGPIALYRWVGSMVRQRTQGEQGEENS
jgi:uncharacterized BrkB/YihY/UPF0761 family membrane protein